MTNNSTNSNIDTKNPKGLWGEFKLFLYKLLDIRHDTDKKGTIEDIKENSPYTKNQKVQFKKWLKVRLKNDSIQIN